MRRIADRWLEWHGSKGTRGKDESWDDYDARMLQAAAEALSNYSAPAPNGRSCWYETWGNKYGKYYVFGPKQEVIGQYKDVPVAVVHTIACRGLTDALRRTMPTTTLTQLIARIP